MSPHPVLAQAKRGAALSQALVPCVRRLQEEQGSSHTAYVYTEAYRPQHSTATCYSGCTLELKEKKVENSILPLPKICDFCVSCMFYGTFIIENVTESAAATC